MAFTVTNTGRRTGVAVPQVYVGFPAAAQEPPRQLKAFGQLALAPGAARTVSHTLDQRAFEYWGTAGWRSAAGNYRVWVGSSSRDLPLAGDLALS